MNTAEYQDLACRLDRLERLLTKLVKGDEVTRPVEPPRLPAEMSAEDRVSSVQAEGRYIFDTQGMEAYKAFWKEQGKKRGHGKRRAS